MSRSNNKIHASIPTGILTLYKFYVTKKIRKASSFTVGKYKNKHYTGTRTVKNARGEMIASHFGLAHNIYLKKKKSQATFKTSGLYLYMILYLLSNVIDYLD